MMDTPFLVLVFAALLTVTALSEPIARALRLPGSVVLAAIGIGIGLLAALAGAAGGEGAIARFFLHPPFSSNFFLYVFLPTLMFHSALGIDMQRLADDWVPVLVLAVLAVVAATLAIGVALFPVAGVPLVACLLLGCIVATTDPVAVIGIFRDVGAPERLVRLVEGESLLNDAAAITMFTVFTALLTGAAVFDGRSLAVDFLVIPLGGALVGFLAARVFSDIIGRVGDSPLVGVTLSLALPYLVYPLAEQLFHLSGLIAVVAAGLTLAVNGPARMSPTAWQHLKRLWDQLAFWASTLIFLLASILIPRLLGGVTAFDLVLLAVLVAASLVARGLILFALLPVLSVAGLSAAISRPFRLVIFWGGLRGAVTLALALAVTENAAMPAEVTRFVAVLATGFTLFTLIVQGLTLRPLMRRLGLDRLTPVDEALRDRAVAVAFHRVAETVERRAEVHRLTTAAADGLATHYRERSRAASGETPLPLDAQVAIALTAVAGRERDLVLEHAGEGTVSADLVQRLLADARTLIDAARLRGLSGYLAANEAALKFGAADALAHLAHARLGNDRYLARRLEARFEVLLFHRIVLDALAPFVSSEVTPVFGAEAGEAIDAALQARRARVERSLEALRLQYPEYAEALQGRFLARLGRATAEREIRHLHESGLINAEVERALLKTASEAARGGSGRLRLDLGLDTRSLVERLPLFALLTEAEKQEIANRLTPRLVWPGDRVIAKGGVGDAAYFISSGAVEVDTGHARFSLGRGDVFGEMALITGKPRTADVTSIGYSALLRLSLRDFQEVLSRSPALKAHVEQLAAERERINAGQ